jgi:hypothetical protein
MMQRGLGEREQLLSIWVQDRLAERDAVEWAVTALKQVRGDLGASTVALFAFLDRHAHERQELSPSIKKLWHLFHTAATDGASQDGILLIYEIKQRLESGTVRTDDIDKLVECIRPHLTAADVSTWAKSSEDAESDDPMQWVRWDFETSLHSNYLSTARLSAKRLAKISSDLLLRLLERGTTALSDSLEVAREVGWAGDGRDLPTYVVHRVFDYDPSEAHNPDDDDDRDPDRYNNNFVPIVRLLSLAFEALAVRESALVTKAVERWRHESGGLFLRLFAFAAWREGVVSAPDVGEFLLGIDDLPFWRWMTFPEVASLRALRWNSLVDPARSNIATRLANGPSDAAFRKDDDVLEMTKKYHRDHELARLIDNGCNVPPRFHELVQARRREDPEFPKKIPSVEPGLPGARAMRVPDGNPDKFTHIPTERLLDALTNANRHAFGQGNDAEAFARTLGGKRRVLDALAALPQDASLIDNAWKLLLSYAHEKADDAGVALQVAEETARLALALPKPLFQSLAGQFSYWLDGTEEHLPHFVGADDLWHALLPYAAAIANEKDTQSVEKDVDLSSAALNEPLGHLLSMFLRRCPTMPIAQEERPPLPPEYVDVLRRLNGRAKEILINRMAIQMNYFVRADKRWLDEFVISPMTLEGDLSDRAWEAFGKFAPLPSSEIWPQLQGAVFRRLSSSGLSPEARRRLAEMCVVVWARSKHVESGYVLDTASLKNSLGFSNDDVRGAAAWQFSTMFRSKEGGGDDTSTSDWWRRVGKTFFKEVWPLEPTLQIAVTANDFARIPAGVGFKNFADAVATILPYLVPFEVWAVMTEFQLDPKKKGTQDIVRAYPEETLILLAVCIDEQQKHGVYDLGRILDFIVEARPKLQRDPRMRMLRKLTLPI